ncbi:MAG: YczE/YyaS/YitT family protein [Longibaculum sp.]
MSKNVKRYILIVLGFMIVGTACAFTLKANVGVGAWDALAKSTSDIVGIEVGTAGIIFNSCCVLGQIIILRKDFRWIQLLQLPLSVLLGVVINFVLYQLLVFPFDSFIGGIIMYICGSTVCAFGVAIVMLLDEVTFALEGFCMAITKIIPVKFSVSRQAADVISIIVILILKFTLDIPWSIGVGTIIGMLTFGPTLGIFMKIFKPILKKQGVLNYE